MRDSRLNLRSSSSSSISLLSTLQDKKSEGRLCLLSHKKVSSFSHFSQKKVKKEDCPQSVKDSCRTSGRHGGSQAYLRFTIVNRRYAWLPPRMTRLLPAPTGRPCCNASRRFVGSWPRAVRHAPLEEELTAQKKKTDGAADEAASTPRV